jgi:ribonuclease Z
VLSLARMKVIPLGTSSGKPTLKRNVSALALIREGEWLLFDCGEGTQTQIARAGLSQSRLVAIFITHLHGDHFNGLPGLLSTMGLDRRTRELTLIGPPGIREYLAILTRLKTLFVNFPLEVREIPTADDLTLVFDTPEYTIKARALVHRLFSLGYRVDEKPRPGKFDVDAARQFGVPEGPLYGKLQSGENVTLPDGSVVSPSDVLGPPRAGKSAAYCLDTRPCPAAIELSYGVDLLIHEATFTETLKDEAYEYGHSTAADAARTAAAAGAKRLLLTHFSSRFPDPSPLLDEASTIFSETRLAEELETVEV